MAITDIKSSRSTLDPGVKELQLFVSETPAPIAMLDRQMRYIAASKRWYKEYRIKYDSIIGFSHYEIFPDIPDRWKKVHQRCLQGATERCEEDEFKRANGKIEWLRWEVRPWHDSRNNIGGIIMLTEVITERKQAELDLVRSNRALEVLSRCNHAMLYTSNEMQLLEEICRIIVQTGNYLMAWVGYAENDEHKSVRPIAHWGFEQGYTDALNITWADEERGRGPTGTAIRTGEICIARNILTDPKFALWREAALERGYASSVAIPLLRGNQVFGAVMIYANEAYAFNTKECQLLENLAENLIYGILALRTENERTEIARVLKQREEHLKFLYEENPSMYFTIKPDGTILSVNDFGAGELGYTVEELSGKSILKLFPASIHQNVLRHLDTCLKKFGELQTWEVQKRCKDGKLIWAKETARAVGTPDGGTAVLIVCRDNTDRKQADEQLKQHAQRLLKAQSIAHFGFWEWKIDTNEVYWSDEVYRIFGVKPENFDVTVEAFMELVHPEDKDLVADNIRKALYEGAEYNFEHRIELPDDKIKYVIENAIVSYDDSGAPVCMEGTVSDITDRKKAEEKITQSQQRLRNFAVRLQEIREEERTHIAREIHDELGQTLTVLKMDMVWLSKNIPKNLGVVPERLNSMIALLDEKLDETRKLAFRIRPAMLDDLGLEAAIECEVADFAERADLKYTVDMTCPNIGKDRNRDTAIFRILQEALTNVVRHANADCIDVRLYIDNSDLVMTVSDNGVGFDEIKIKGAESLGLTGMQERAAALGGQIMFNNVGEGGTRVTVVMPVAGVKHD